MTRKTAAPLLLALLTAPLFGASLPTVGLPAHDLADLVERTVPSVVRILAVKVDAPWANGLIKADSPAAPQRGPRPKTVSGEGSGVIVSPDGYLLTNHHVIDNAVKITVELNDDRAFPAKVIASDAATDLAVLKIDAQNLPAIAFGDSAKLRVGESVVAIGNPFGVGTTVTSGIVSAMGSPRTNAAGDEDYIQTDAAINPGNSGGPLLNLSGQLVGINTAIISPSGGSSGIGFALPSNVARRVMKELIDHGQVTRGFLGVGLQPMSPGLSEVLHLTRPGGAIITDVAPESPAAQAGVKKGDVVLGMNGRAIRDFDRLRLYIAEARPGATISLLVNRDGQEQTLQATLATKPSSPTEATPQKSGELLSGAVLSELTAPSRQELGLAPDVNGLLVMAVDPDGDSAEAGLKAGDVIVFANRHAVLDVPTFEKAAGDSRTVLLEVNRQGGTFFLAVPR